MPDIFISYASEDREKAKQLGRALEAQGWTVWWDRTIPAGKNFADVIDKALGQARCIVAMWSAVSVKKNWVLEEAEDGLARRILVPVFIEPIELPRGFRRIQAADLSDWDGTESSEAFRQLVKDVAQLLGPPPGEEDGEAQRQEAERKRPPDAATRETEQEARPPTQAQAARSSEDDAAKNSGTRTTPKADEQVAVAGRTVEEAGGGEGRHSTPQKGRSALLRWMGVVLTVLLAVGLVSWQVQRETALEARQALDQLSVMVSQGRSAVGEAESSANQARASLERILALSEQRAASQSDIDAAQRDSEVANKKAKIAMELLIKAQQEVNSLQAGGGIDEGRLKRTRETVQSALGTLETITRSLDEQERQIAVIADKTKQEPDSRQQLEEKRREAEKQEEKNRLAEQKAQQEAQRLSEERKAQQEMQRLAEERKAQQEMQRLAEERKAKLEAQRRADETARRAHGRIFSDQLKRYGTAGPKMVVIREGRYRMGSSAEKLRPSVDIGQPFAMGVREVSVGEFGLFVKAMGDGFRTEAERDHGCRYDKGDNWDWGPQYNWRSPGFTQTERHPVVCVSFKDAQAYVNWLSRETGENYRLLSEAEWEYAARAGSTADGNRDTGAEPICSFANIDDRDAGCLDGHKYTAPAGSFTPNAFQLLDTLGNVYEWTADCWSSDLVGVPKNGVARTGNESECRDRVIRGGSWDSAPKNAHLTTRQGHPTDKPAYDVGFRVARDL